jgi:hypothetical protein
VPGCTPTTCVQQGTNCGTISDGCGRTLTCGDCTDPDICGGGNPGTPGVCGCTKTTCAAQNAQCGTIADGCDGQLDCGICTAPYTCGGGTPSTPNRCGCTQTTCTAAGAQCGTISDGCDGTLDCGGCPPGQTCGEGGVCGEVCGSEFCPAPDAICCNGACCDGCCGADGSCGACLVFVTSNVSQGNLGGLAGADLACQTLAELATPSPLPGEYTAWLSIDDGPDQSPASGRFRHSGQPYRLVNGTQIAASWADLTDGTLAAPIALTESGQGVSSATRFVWTNTRTDGTAGGHFGNGLLSCGEWQLTSGSSGNMGDATHTGVGWTFIGNGSCNSGRVRLFCFQQR